MYDKLSQDIGGEFFASAVAAYPDCVRILDPNGRVEFMNPRGLELFEIDDFERNRGAYWPNLWPEDARAVVEEALQAAIAGETRSFQTFCPTAKGAPRWWDTTIFPVYVSGCEAPFRLLSRSRDITQERETRALLDAVVQNIPAVLIAKEVRTGKYVLINRAAEEAFGYSREEMLGKTDHDFFPPEQADLFQTADMHALESGDIGVLEEDIRTQRNGLRRFRMKKIGLLDAAGVAHSVGIGEDVTDTRAAEEALRQALVRAEAASQAKSDFLATMSHEIRTPLNGILGMIQVMRSDNPDPVQKDRLRIMHRSGETLLAILDDVLDLSRIEAGKMELEIVDFDLEHLVRGAAAAFAPLAERKGVEFVLDIAPSAQAVFAGDPTHIRRLLYNLISNAVKFTDAGQVGLSISYQDGAVGVRVSDTGIGISIEQRATLFEKFNQGDSSRTRRFGGSGLGLAICRGLLDQMGGTIEVASVPGEGSSFSVNLPLKLVGPACAPRSSQTPTAPAPAVAAPDLRILAAEDNEVNQLVLRTLLEHVGITPTIVANGVEAVAAWETGHWDAILMDIQMPVMDGLSAAAAIRQRELISGRARTPILAVTANTMTHQTPEYFAAGMDQVVPKPLKAATLFEAIAAALDAVPAEAGDRFAAG